jgi:hypothetical protein
MQIPPATIGILHPGEMGAVLGGLLRARGHRVLCAADGRSAKTRERAAAAGLEPVGSLAALAAQHGPRLVVEEQVEGHAYRLLFLDGVLLGAVLREAPGVVGDRRASPRSGSSATWGCAASRTSSSRAIRATARCG